MTRYIPLVGGLGNQLFIVAYGLFQNLYDDHEVQFCLGATGFGNVNHGHNLLEEIEFGFPVRARLERPVEAWVAKGQRLASRKGLGKLIEATFSTVHLDEGVPLDRRVSYEKKNLNRHLKIRDSGYFQNPAYLAKLQEMGILTEIVPAAPSSWFKETRDRISENGGIGIHVRRGDFEKTGGPGVLSVEYYKRALEDATSSDGGNRVFIFSDSIESVEREFLEHNWDFEIEFVSPPPESSPIESMALLSQFTSLIISNSTFSWWSATTGQEHKTVMSPTRWSRIGPEPAISLNLAGWTLREALWRT